jgi:hypothetical protein
MKYIYTGLTWLGTTIALNFCVIPFALMEIRKAWYFYQTWYFIVPILSIILAITLNGASSKSKKKPETKSN